jgi:hypothetical protein
MDSFQTRTAVNINILNLRRNSCFLKTPPPPPQKIRPEDNPYLFANKTVKAKANGREPQSCLGQVFNFKLGYLLGVLHVIHKHTPIS